MNYYKNLQRKTEKSKLVIILSLFSILFGISYFALIIMSKKGLMLYNWIYSVYFILYGLILILREIGYPIESLIGKSFVKINEQELSIKANILEKEQKINWSEIQKLNYHMGKFIVTKKDASTLEFVLTKLDYKTVQEVKEFVFEMAKRKDILIN